MDVESELATFMADHLVCNITFGDSVLLGKRIARARVYVALQSSRSNAIDSVLTNHFKMISNPITNHA